MRMDPDHTGFTSSSSESSIEEERRAERVDTSLPVLFGDVKRLGDKSVKNSTVWQHGKDIGDYSYAAGYSTIKAKETAKNQTEDTTDAGSVSQTKTSQYPVNSTLIGAKYACNIHNVTKADVPTESPIVGKRRLHNIVSITPQHAQEPTNRKISSDTVKKAGTVASESEWNTVETGAIATTTISLQGINAGPPITQPSADRPPTPRQLETSTSPTAQAVQRLTQLLEESLEHVQALNNSLSESNPVPKANEVSTQTDVAALTHQRSIIQPDNGLGKPKAIVIAASKVTSLDQQQLPRACSTPHQGRLALKFDQTPPSEICAEMSGSLPMDNTNRLTDSMFDEMASSPTQGEIQQNPEHRRLIINVHKLPSTDRGVMISEWIQNQNECTPSTHTEGGYTTDPDINGQPEQTPDAVVSHIKRISNNLDSSSMSEYNQQTESASPALKSTSRPRLSDETQLRPERDREVIQRRLFAASIDTEMETASYSERVPTEIPTTQTTSNQLAAQKHTKVNGDATASKQMNSAPLLLYTYGGKRRRYSVSTPIQSVVRPYTRSEPYSRNAEPITFRRTKSAKATYSSKSPLLLAESYKRNQNNDVASRQKYSSKSPLSLCIPAHSGSPSHMPAHRSRSSSCNQKKSSEKSSIASLHSPERELGQDTQMSPDLLDGEKQQSPPVQEQAEDITMPSLKEKDNQDAENEGLSDRSHSQQSPRMSVRSGPDRENSRASNSQCSEVAPVVDDGENTEGNVEETYVSTDESSEGLSVYPVKDGKMDEVRRRFDGLRVLPMALNRSSQGGVAQVKSGFTTDDSYVVTSDQSVSFANEEADSPAADQTTEAADNMEFEERAEDKMKLARARKVLPYIQEQLNNIAKTYPRSNRRQIPLDTLMCMFTTQP